MEYTAKAIVDLNEAAVLKMRQQQMLEAICILRTAAEALQSIFYVTGNDDHTERSRSLRKWSVNSRDKDATGTEILNNNEDKIGTVFSVGVLSQEEAVAASSVSTNDGILPLYDRAFTFLDLYNLDLELHENKCTLFGMILYNLGLAHHIMGRNLGIGGEVVLAEAIRFYRLAHCALEEAKDAVCVEVHMVILLGLINNVGTIHAMQFRREETMDCIIWIRRAILSRESATLDAVDVEIFVNALFAPDDPCRFAPAA